MKKPRIDAVALKRTLQQKAEAKMARLSKQEQLDFLRKRFGHLTAGKATSTNRAYGPKQRTP